MAALDMAAAEISPGIGTEKGERNFMLWPADDSARLLCLLQARGAAQLLVANQAASRQYRELVGLKRKAEAEPEKFQQVFEAHAALASLECVLAEAENFGATAADGSSAAPSSFEGALAELASLEDTLHTEMRYIYGPDWELKPGKLISKKGTWLKKTTNFSWEIADHDKFYMPHGVIMPVLQIGRVMDQVELKRHEWACLHNRVWVKPAIIQTMDARRGTWFVYRPHFEVVGTDIIALVDTWLKRSCQMSGDLQPFELIYVPKDLCVHLSREPEVVEEQCEKLRHPHVHQHRMVSLASMPITVKQEKYDIFVGQSDQMYR